MPAVNKYARSGDVVRQIAGEHDGHPADVLGFADALIGNVAQQ